MKVVSIDTTKIEENNLRKEEIYKILDELREQVENGTITDFVSASNTSDGAMQMHVACHEMHLAIGMLEISKQIIINNHLE